MSENNNINEMAQTLMLGYLCIASEKEASLVRKVEILDRFELEDKMIAKICGCNTQSVRDARVKRKNNKIRN